MAYKVNINDTVHQVEVDGDTPLLWVIRDTLGLNGTKFGCGIAECGACTVHVDGVATRSCVIPIDSIGGASVVTIENAGKKYGRKLQDAWVAEDVPQCGYCQSGMIMAATALLNENPSPSDAEIDDAMTNICRCGTYTRIRAAIHRAAKA